jgi:hypothetical protein
MGKIVTVHYTPLGNDDRFQWCAFHWTNEYHYLHRGWGATKAEALDDLARLDRERAEAEEDNYEQAAEDAQRRADAREGF